MIRGTVSPAREPVVRLRVRGPDGLTADVDTLVDTGFDGLLILPATLAVALSLAWVSEETATLADGSMLKTDCYDVEVEWGSG